LYSPQGRPLSRAGALSEIRETNCELFDRCFFRRINLGSSVVDPHHINADQDSTYHPGADPGADADSDIYLFDADPDPDPSFIERKSAKIVSS
jgi:hypothetical protein